MVLTAVDWVLIALAAVGAVGGAFTGFFNGISKILGIVGGLFFALIFSLKLALLLESGTGLGHLWALGISYVLIFMAVYLIIAAIGSALSNFFKAAKLGFVDRMLGFLLGAIEAALALSLLWLLLSNQKLVKLGPSFENSWIINNILDKLNILHASLFQKLRP